jgi:hypothetical protein
VHAEGSATITANFGGASASVFVNGGDANDAVGGAGQGAGTDTSPATDAADETPSATETAADETPSAVETAAEESSAPVTVGREISVLHPPKAASENDDGGVQNWRTDEPATGAAELPIIREDNPAIVFAAAAALAMFLLGALFKFTAYNKEIL